MTAHDAVLKRLVKVGPPLIAAGSTTPNHCVMASAVGQMVLSELGIDAMPFPVEVSVCNAAWMQWIAEDCPGGQAEQIRRGAYLLTNQPDWKGGAMRSRKTHAPWDGHLVLTVGPWLLDLNSGGFTRPQHKVLTPPGMLVELGPDRTVIGEWHGAKGVVTTIQYRPLVAPYANDYRESKDWNRRGALLPIVQAILAALRIEAGR